MLKHKWLYIQVVLDILLLGEANYISNHILYKGKKSDKTWGYFIKYYDIKLNKKLPIKTAITTFKIKYKNSIFLTTVFVNS